MKIRKGDLLHVFWVDSARPLHQAWMPPDDIQDEACEIETVGWVTSVNDGAVSLAQSYDVTTGNVCGAITIPRRALTKVKRLGR